MSQTQTVALARQLGILLVDRGWMLACAESCTGGMLSAAITDVAGSSQWFDRGFVTYSNAAKSEQLRVGIDTLERFGAVSEETAMEMAAGALDASHAQVAVSTTGIAGPGGAVPGKPVGMVCFGFAQRSGQGITTRAVTKVFEGDRAQVRTQAVAFALHGVLDLVQP
ncbi:MAG TPA: nicotinamide-nucleotide amidohydrolase family protein [Pusillimonas sp.]|uniref:CinA family protein n=1 Tax=unclassified Pusillimonas TaxID=2640016 RepID=UPI00263123BE|nr:MULTISPECIES: nicotinamide-nucleotide amidohydrolase family protein [unclassified Pusillimonas]HLU19522.1 nicotinamide-nucleotide amidohydrolase family protein [Pusillimonas sp.]